MRHRRLAVLLPAVAGLATLTRAAVAQEITYTCYPGTPQQFVIDQRDVAEQRDRSKDSALRRLPRTGRSGRKRSLARC
jgi:hypothetical protein